MTLACNISEKIIGSLYGRLQYDTGHVMKVRVTHRLGRLCLQRRKENILSKCQVLECPETHFGRAWVINSFVGSYLSQGFVWILHCDGCFEWST